MSTRSCGVLGLAALLGAACTEVVVPRDAGIDGGDGGRDAGRRDAGPRDGGRDAAGDGGVPDSVEIEPGWVRLEGFSRNCRNERATHPAPLVRVRWEPCPFDAESCVYLPWDDRYVGRGFRAGASDHDGTKGLVALQFNGTGQLVLFDGTSWARGEDAPPSTGSPPT